MAIAGVRWREGAHLQHAHLVHERLTTDGVAIETHEKNLRSPANVTALVAQRGLPARGWSGGAIEREHQFVVELVTAANGAGLGVDELEAGPFEPAQGAQVEGVDLAEHALQACPGRSRLDELGRVR